MKKLFAMLLALLITVSLCACGGNAIEKYVEKNGEALRSSMEQSFATSSGMTCKSSIEVEGAGFVISININELEDVEESIKQQMQSTFDLMNSTFEAMLDDMQAEVPELEYYKIRVCEKDGDVLAVIHIKE